MSSIRTIPCLMVAAMLATAGHAADDGFTPLLSGEDLSGWTQAEGWAAEDGVLKVVGRGGNIFTEKEFENFELRFEFNIPEGGNSGVFFRRGGLEVQLLDDYAEKYANLQDWQYNGALYGFAAPSERVSKRPGQWQTMAMRLAGQQLTIILNGTTIVDTNLDDHRRGENPHPGLAPGPGRLGFQNYGGAGIELRHIRIKELAGSATTSQ